MVTLNEIRSFLEIQLKEDRKKDGLSPNTEPKLLNRGVDFYQNTFTAGVPKIMAHLDHLIRTGKGDIDVGKEGDFELLFSLLEKFVPYATPMLKTLENGMMYRGSGDRSELLQLLDIILNLYIQDVGNNFTLEAAHHSFLQVAQASRLTQDICKEILQSSNPREKAQEYLSQPRASS